MAKIHLTDKQWDFIRSFLPPPARTGRPRADDRHTIEGILFVLTTGCRWQDLPREYGAPTTAWRRLKRWTEEGVWERIWRAALASLDQRGALDWSIAFLDGAFAPAKKGGEKVGLTKKGKGTKWMLVVDGNGLPLGFHLDSANHAEVRLAEQTLDTIRVARPRGRPRRRPDKLVADRGYDSASFRRALRRRGIQMCIPAYLSGGVRGPGDRGEDGRCSCAPANTGYATKSSAPLPGSALCGGCSSAGSASCRSTAGFSRLRCCSSAFGTWSRRRAWAMSRPPVRQASQRRPSEEAWGKRHGETNTVDTYTRDEFRRLLLRAIAQTRAVAQREVAAPLPEANVLMLNAFEQGGHASTEEEVLTWLYQDGAFPRLVVVGVCGIVDDQVLVRLAPSGHGYVRDRAVAWNHPPELGPFQCVGLMLSHGVWDRPRPLSRRDLEDAAAGWPPQRRS